VFTVHHVYVYYVQLMSCGKIWEYVYVHDKSETKVSVRITDFIQILSQIQIKLHKTDTAFVWREPKAFLDFDPISQTFCKKRTSIILKKE
jgi:hypothetical protein